MDDKQRDSIIAIWKTIVEVQQHFNEIEMKIRGLFITIVVAIGAAQGFLIEKRFSIPVHSVTILYATVMPLLGVLAAYLFYFVDRFWYHRLLLGSVLQGGFIEEKYAAELPELGLGSKISKESPVELHNWFARILANLVVTDPRYKKTKKLHSDAKIEFFYKSIVYLFALWFLATVVFVGVTVNGQSMFELMIAGHHSSDFDRYD
jgi:hypothetical protein